MTSIGVLQIAIFFGLILISTKPLGAFMTKVFDGQRTFLHPVLRWLEVLTYKLIGVKEEVEQRWTQYTASLLSFSIFGFLLTYLLQRTQGYLVRRSILEAMPGIPTQPFQGDVRNDGSYIEALAWEADVERVANQTSAAVCADEIADPERLNTAGAADMRAHALGVLHEPIQFDSILRVVAEFCQALAHRGFGEELRYHHGYRVRLVGCRIAMQHDRRLVIASIVPIHSLRWIPATGRDNAVHDTQILEHLLATRLDSLAARTLEGSINLVDQTEADATAGEIYRQR